MPTFTSIEGLQYHPLSPNRISQYIAFLGIYKLDGIKESFPAFLMHFLPTRSPILGSVDHRRLPGRSYHGSIRIKRMNGSEIYRIQTSNCSGLPARSPIFGL
jgi:hypothetical protein